MTKVLAISSGEVVEANLPDGTFGFTLSDESTSLTSGAAKFTFRMPWAMTLTEVRLCVATAPTGSPLIVNVKLSGTSIFSTKPQIDATSDTSVGSGTTQVITTSSLPSNGLISVDIDQVGSSVAGKGLKIVFVGAKS